MKEVTENARSLMVVTRQAMLDPTYNDPPDVGGCCGHFLICQVHVTRRPPHSPHFTRSDMPQRRMLQHNSLLCAEDIKEMWPCSECHRPMRHMRHAQGPAQSPATPTATCSRSPERQSALELSRCPSSQQSFIHNHTGKTTWYVGFAVLVKGRLS